MACHVLLSDELVPAPISVLISGPVILVANDGLLPSVVIAGAAVFVAPLATPIIPLTSAAVNAVTSPALSAVLPMIVFVATFWYLA